MSKLTISQSEMVAIVQAHMGKIFKAAICPTVVSVFLAGPQADPAAGIDFEVELAAPKAAAEPPATKKAK